MATPDQVADDPVAAADEDRVHLDHLGEVATPTVSGLVLAPGLPEASRTRLQALAAGDGSLEITEDLDRAGEARLVVLSTRVPRAELTACMARVTATSTSPVVALAHAGGESQSVEIVRRGGVAVIAEGNEPAIAGLLTGDPSSDTGLLDSYDRHVARTESAAQGTRGRDPVTGLPDRTSLDMRLANLEQEGEVPRLVLVRVVRAPLVPEELGEDAATLVRRRMATQFLHVARAHDTAIFALEPWEFALVTLSLSPNAVQSLGRDLDRIAETYSPSGVNTLGVAVGHAGPEVSTDIAALREAAQRALDVAVGDRTVIVVGADALSLGVSATTELESALQIVEHVERQTARPVGAHMRIGEIAAAIATGVGYDGIARSRIQLAAHLHAVGLASLRPEALHDLTRLSGEDLEVFRQYPVRSATYLAPSAGREVAAAVHGHRERWDGAGFPDGIVGSEIPISSRIVATAIAVGDLLDAPGPLALDDVAGALHARAGHDLDPDMVAVAVELLDDLLALAPTVAA